jgi:CheY-like chemotaxis protein
VMPGPLRSSELARKAKERLPGLAVLFTSGYTENSIVHGGRLDEGIELLSKPYTKEALARKIRHTLRNEQQRNRATEPRPAPWRADDVARPAIPPLRVLLVEDDDLIRASTTEMLASMGHHVAEAADSGDALELLDRIEFDVMVTDVSLPGASGTELAHRALRRQPDLRIVFASGYGSLPRLDGQAGNAILLRKPYDEKGMLKALQAATALAPPRH